MATASHGACGCHGANKTVAEVEDSMLDSTPVVVVTWLQRMVPLGD